MSVLTSVSTSESTKVTATIRATGMYVPERIVTNEHLSRFMDTSDEWIQQRSGIKERRFAPDHVTPSDMAVEAATKALHDAGLKPQDIDFLIVATLSSEHYFPGTSAFVQAKLGMGTTPAMDVRTQCSGFLYSLNMGQLLIESRQAKRVLVIGVEIQSRALDLTTRGRDMAVLFGDGAGAVILEASPSPEHGIMGIKLHSDGQPADTLWLE
jgi:3-oxoacyl-[acyl-carrier-protein] synthase-3